MGSLAKLGGRPQVNLSWGPFVQATSQDFAPMYNKRKGLQLRGAVAGTGEGEPCPRIGRLAFGTSLRER